MVALDGRAGGDGGGLIEGELGRPRADRERFSDLSAWASA